MSAYEITSLNVSFWPACVQFYTSKRLPSLIVRTATAAACKIANKTIMISLNSNCRNQNKNKQMAMHTADSLRHCVSGRFLFASEPVFFCYSQTVVAND